MVSTLDKSIILGVNNQGGCIMYFCLIATYMQRL